jgi:glycosyltransferase involved in cell wall biosynthesis
MDFRSTPIVCYAEDWGRLPSSTEHLMRGLSKTHPILWVDSLGLRTPSAASSGDLKRIIAKVRKFSAGICEVEPNIFVLTPLVLPFHRYSLVRRFNRRLLKVYVGGFLKKRRYDRFIQWSSSPTSSSMVHALGEAANVYYIGDEFSEFTQFDKELVIALERQLLVKSDLLLVVSDRLYATKSRFNALIEKVPHGCDFEHFARTSSLTERDIPEDLSRIPHPRIGYYGLIRDWFDFDMLKHVFTRHPEWSLALVGPSDTDTSSIDSLPNVHLLGRKEYAALPGYLRGFDVGIIPYRKTEITLNANPLKLLEYLSSGIPTVTTDLPAVRPYKDGLRIAKDAAQFEAAIKDALAETGAEARTARQALGRENSWRSRVELVESIFDKHMYPLVGRPTKPVVMHLIAAMNIAGAEKVVLNLINKGHDNDSVASSVVEMRPDVAAPFEQRVTSFVRISDGAGVDFLREVESKGVRTDRIAISKRFDLSNISALRRIIKRHNVGLLHTHGYRADIAGVIAAKLSGIPIVVTAHGFTSADSKLNRNERTGCWFIRWADRVIAVSENVRQTLIKAGVAERKIARIPNAVSFDYFSQPGKYEYRREWKIRPDEIVIGTAGRLSSEKAQGNLIKAVERLPEPIRNRVRIVIAGEGPEASSIILTAQNSELTGQLTMAGFVQDMRSFYQALDIFCLPSLTEGHPLTIMEAAACGVPVVASKVGAIGQLISDGVDGFTPEPRDIDALVTSLEKCLGLPDRGKDFGRKLREKLSRHYDLDPWAVKINALYADLLKR